MADYATPPEPVTPSLKPFKVDIPDEDLDSLRQLVSLSPLGPQTYENSLEDMKLGVNWKFMTEAKEAWQTSYDWRKCEKRINSFPNFKLRMHVPRREHEVFSIHFIGLFSRYPDAIPIVLLHGWPGSVLEFLDLLDLVVKKYPDPAKLPYHIIVPSLPGYAFSSGAPYKRNFPTVEIADIVNTLMRRLGFIGRGYLAQGGDIGSRVARDLAGRHKECKGCHINMIPLPKEPVGIADADITPLEREGLERRAEFYSTGAAYANEHGTKPATIGFALSASPLALLAWIGEKFHAWTDQTPSQETILDHVTLYWLTKTFARAIYPYRDSRSSPVDLLDPENPCHINEKPLGYSFFPREPICAPVAWAERTGNLVWSRRHEAGGHFAALERPADLLADIEDFAAQVWPGTQGAK